MSSDITRTFERGNLHELAEFLVTPARSGIFLTRSRIRSLAGEMGLRAGVQNRARMLENLFREAGSDGRVQELLGSNRRGGGGEPRPVPRLVESVPAVEDRVARVEQKDAGSQASPRPSPKMGARHERGCFVGLRFREKKSAWFESPLPLLKYPGDVFPVREGEFAYPSGEFAVEVRFRVLFHARRVNGHPAHEVLVHELRA